MRDPGGDHGAAPGAQHLAHGIRGRGGAGRQACGPEHLEIGEVGEQVRGDDNGDAEQERAG